MVILTELTIHVFGLDSFMTSAMGECHMEVVRESESNDLFRELNQELSAEKLQEYSAVDLVKRFALASYSVKASFTNGRNFIAESYSALGDELVRRIGP